jgi:hypothetical protein
MSKPHRLLIAAALVLAASTQAIAADTDPAAPDPWQDFHLRAGAFSMPSDLLSLSPEGTSAASAEQRRALLGRIQTEANERANCASIESVSVAAPPGANVPVAPDGTRTVRELWTLKQCGFRMPYLITLRFPTAGKPTYHIAPQAPTEIPAGVAVITDAQVRAEYDRVVNLGQLEYKVRHVLVSNRNQAQAALARIRKGESFETVAGEASSDPGSSKKGGDLGWAVPAYFVKPFADAMLRLAPRGLTDEPVQTPFGWHLIEVTDTRPRVIPPFEQVKDKIADSLRRRAEAAQ